jgi:hypothetical protein
MARRRWIEDGLVVEAPEMADTWRQHISDAWDCVVTSRAAFLREDWEETDRWSREACRTAVEALLFSRGWKPAVDFCGQIARDYCFDTFGVMGNQVFTRAELVGEFLPISWEVDEHRKRLFEKTVAAASELVALVECHIAVEKMPPPPPDPHVKYPRPRRYY